MRPLGIRDRLHYSLEKQICLGSTEQFSTKNTEEKLLLGNKKKLSSIASKNSKIFLSKYQI